MTNLKTVNQGFNKFCGPAVLSILTGKSTDECAYAITKINGDYNIKGVQLSDLLKAADKLGYTHESLYANGSLFSTLISIVNNDGLYIVTIPKHFVCIEVKDKKIYFCDNHTKEPIPAASSARLSVPVVAINKVFKKPLPPKPEKVEPSYRQIQLIECNYCKSTGKTEDTVYHTFSCPYRIGLEANEL